MFSYYLRVRVGRLFASGLHRFGRIGVLCKARRLEVAGYALLGLVIAGPAKGAKRSTPEYCGGV